MGNVYSAYCLRQSQAYFYSNSVGNIYIHTREQKADECAGIIEKIYAGVTAEKGTYSKNFIYFVKNCKKSQKKSTKITEMITNHRESIGKSQNGKHQNKSQKSENSENTKRH